MRTVSFSNDQVRKAFNDDFVSCYTNTEGDPSAGGSIPHAPNSQPGPCGPTAGRQNVQTFFLTPDNEIFHVAGGFRSADDLISEIKFAKELYKRMKANPDQAKETVVAAHSNHLKKIGVDPKKSGFPFGDQMIGMPSPKDMGFDISKFTGRKNGASNMFDQINKQRVAKDHQYLVKNPLTSRKSFESNPQELTGHGKTFFASQGAGNVLNNFNGIGDKKVITNKKQ